MRELIINEKVSQDQVTEVSSTLLAIIEIRGGKLVGVFLVSINMIMYSDIKLKYDFVSWSQDCLRLWVCLESETAARADVPKLALI